MEYLHSEKKKSAKEFIEFVDKNYVVFRQSETVVWDKDIAFNQGELVYTDNNGEYGFDEVYRKFLMRNKNLNEHEKDNSKD